MVADTYRVDLVFNVVERKYDPNRFGRVMTSLAELLPSGSQTLNAKSGAEDGKGGVSAKVRSLGPAQALHFVSRALELALAKEDPDLEHLAPIIDAHVELEPG